MRSKYGANVHNKMDEEEVVSGGSRGGSSIGGGSNDIVLPVAEIDGFCFKDAMSTWLWRWLQLVST